MLRPSECLRICLTALVSLLLAHAVQRAETPKPCFTIVVDSTMAGKDGSRSERHHFEERFRPATVGDSIGFYTEPGDCAIAAMRAGDTRRFFLQALHGVYRGVQGTLSATAKIDQIDRYRDRYVVVRRQAKGATLEFSANSLLPSDRDEDLIGVCAAQSFEPRPQVFNLTEDDLKQFATLRKSITLTMPLGENDCVGKATAVLSAILEPVDAEAEIIPPDNYNTWLPEAGEDESTAGNGIVVKVKLHKRGDPQKSAGTKAKFRFALSDVSHELGVCLNWPYYEQSKTTPDLKIDQKANPSLDVAGDGQSATTRNSGDSATVTITSYDWGAYGHLTAILDDGSEVTAYVLGDQSKPALTIPKDDNGNHIADFWEKHYLGGSSAANADDDLIPLGSGDPGDGLSLYEEYRGFRVQGAHIRTSPIEKDIFIADVGNLGLGYLAQSGLVTHLIDRNEADETAQSGNQIDAANPMIINPNRGFATLGPQHGLFLMDTDMPGYYGYAQGTGPGPPKTTWAVQVDKARCLSVNAQQLNWAVAHELAHGCNVWHHGDINYKISRWRELQRDGRTWGFWLPYPDGDVAAQGGQESGVEECIMRYEGENLYETATGPIQWEKAGSLQRGAAYPPIEPAGTIFCDDYRGTGANAPGRRGGPKAGDALRGKCSTQFCVNDSKPCTGAEEPS